MNEGTIQGSRSNSQESRINTARRDLDIDRMANLGAFESIAAQVTSCLIRLTELVAKPKITATAQHLTGPTSSPDLTAEAPSTSLDLATASATDRQVYPDQATS
ncbi:hypothetical protein Amsp01_035450 [Amycolatopsis sp. NBRC 101858]|nr:hypothetical protein Amsp01_035450 [Amycolatopsis sp. NBRC 101858]